MDNLLSVDGCRNGLKEINFIIFHDMVYLMALSREYARIFSYLKQIIKMESIAHI